MRRASIIPKSKFNRAGGKYKVRKKLKEPLISIQNKKSKNSGCLVVLIILITLTVSIITL